MASFACNVTSYTTKSSSQMSTLFHSTGTYPYLAHICHNVVRQQRSWNSSSCSHTYTLCSPNKPQGQSAVTACNVLFCHELKRANNLPFFFKFWIWERFAVVSLYHLPEWYRLPKTLNPHKTPMICDALWRHITRHVRVIKLSSHNIYVEHIEVRLDGG